MQADAKLYVSHFRLMMSIAIILLCYYPPLFFINLRAHQAGRNDFQLTGIYFRVFAHYIFRLFSSQQVQVPVFRESVACSCQYVLLQLLEPELSPADAGVDNFQLQPRCSTR